MKYFYMGPVQEPSIVLDKAKKWLKHEVSESKQILDDEIDESACEEHSILEGRLECAEGLLFSIDQWEKEE